MDRILIVAWLSITLAFVSLGGMVLVTLEATKTINEVRAANCLCEEPN